MLTVYIKQVDATHFCFTIESPKTVLATSANQYASLDACRTAVAETRVLNAGIDVIEEIQVLAGRVSPCV